MHVIYDEHYEKIDLPFYKEQISPYLPDAVLDFHTHIWEADQWLKKPWDENTSGGKYMVVEDSYSIDSLVSDGKLLFPDKEFRIVCFGEPSPAIDILKTNEYAASAGSKPGLFPLLIAGKGLQPAEEIRQDMSTGKYCGYKVFLNWVGDDYGHVEIEDMIGQDEMAIANDMHLPIMFHVPGAKRLADPRIQNGIGKLAKDYPQANIILAHCGRCYLPDEMKAAIGSIVDLENVYLDTTMVMAPTVLQIAFEHIGPDRVVFGTDLPIAAMRGRRVYSMDHWVDIVLEGYPPSAYRVASDGIRATYMVYEIILAIIRAAYMSGIDSNALKGVFLDNGMRLLGK